MDGKRAREVEVETKKQAQELKRKEEEVILKQNELKKLEESNEEIQKHQYDRQIEK